MNENIELKPTPNQENIERNTVSNNAESLKMPIGLKARLDQFFAEFQPMLTHLDPKGRKNAEQFRKDWTEFAMRLYEEHLMLRKDIATEISLEEMHEIYESIISEISVSLAGSLDVPKDNITVSLGKENGEIWHQAIIRDLNSKKENQDRQPTLGDYAVAIKVAENERDKLAARQNTDQAFSFSPEQIKDITRVAYDGKYKPGDVKEATLMAQQLMSEYILASYEKNKRDPNGLEMNAIFSKVLDDMKKKVSFKQVAEGYQASSKTTPPAATNNN